MTASHTLYGMAASLYTGKVRAYMRYNQVPFTEEHPGGERFNSVVRKVVGRWIIPVVETPDGEFIQDGTNILDHFEACGFSQHSIFPDDPRLRVLAHLFELFGGEGLLRPAMHYRWNFDETNLEFIKGTFEDLMAPGLSKEEKAAAFDFSSKRMRKATAFFGATAETLPVIEESYGEFLALLNEHLSDYPFLLGGHPTVGDYGLFSPLYAHLGRDPKPLHLMQTTAPRVHRWTERMNMPERTADAVVVTAGDGLISADEMPDTLKALMRYVAEDYLPEITAHIAFANKWLEDQAEGNQEHNPKERAIGMAEFQWRGKEISTAVMPYRFYLLQRLQDVFDAMDAEQKTATRALFSETGLEPLLNVRTTRRVIRQNHLEVWD